MKSKNFSRHLPHYFPLIGIFTAGALAFWIFSYDQQFQIGAAVSVAVAHAVWGIVHHFIHKDISFGIILEYVAISLLGLTVLLSIILRS